MNEALRNAAKEADVVVMGAGIIGLCNALMFARQKLKVVVIDNLVHEKKVSYKVGESLLSHSNVFLRTMGDLDGFLKDSHPKLGVWFTNGMEGEESFNNQTEWAHSTQESWQGLFPDTLQFRASFQDKQIVRPEAEAYQLKRLRKYENVTILDTALVKDVTIYDDNRPHDIEWVCRKTKETGMTRAKWIIDSAGRRRFLARKFNHAIDFEDDFQTTAVWAQFSHVKEELFDDVWEYSYPSGVKARRDKHTCHLWGQGYWIWIIRLEGDRISVGVTFDQKQPPQGKTPKDQYWNVINRYPILTKLLKEENMLEFRMYKDVQYTTDTFVSEKRYGIVGDAATNVDAYYSQGISMSLKTSFHISDIVYRDITENYLDTEYIKRVNRNFTEDWLIVRSFIKEKYTSAIKDNRFFILSHLLDNIVLSTGLNERWNIARILSETNCNPSVETPLHKKLRKRLRKNLYHSTGMSLHIVSPRTARKMIEYFQKKMGKRARWRIENGVKMPKMKLLWPPLPKLYKFPFTGKKELIDLTGKELEIKHATLFLPKAENTSHLPFRLIVPIQMIQFLIVYFYDGWNTRILKITKTLGISSKASRV